MPPSSTNRFLTAPVKATRSSRRHLHLVSCQEPIRSLLGAYMSPGPLGTLGLLEPLGLLGPLGPLRLLGPLKPLRPLKPLE